MMWKQTLCCLIISTAVAGEAHQYATVLDRIGYEWPVGPNHIALTSPSHAQSVQALILAREAMLAGHEREALNAYIEAIEADPGNDSAWRGIATLSQAFGQPRLSAQAWHQLLILQPEDEMALERTAEVALQQGRRTEALALLLRRAMLGTEDDQEKHIRTQAALVVLLKAHAEHELADEIQEDLHGEAMRFARSGVIKGLARQRWDWLIQRLVTEGSSVLAREMLENRLIEHTSLRPADRGRCISASLAIDAAAADHNSTRQLLERLPEDHVKFRLDFRRDIPPADMWTQAAVMHGTLGNEEGAAMLLEKALDEDANHGLALNNLGWTLLVQGDRDRARPMLELAWRLSPDHPATLDSIGWLRFLDGQIQDQEDQPGALRLMQKAARESDQVDPMIPMHLGDVELAAGYTEAARRTWRHALALLEHEGFKANRLHVHQRVQLEEWGVIVMPPHEVYDLEFGGLASELRERLSSSKPMDLE